MVKGRPKLEFIQDIMHFLLICKFKKDKINSNREKVETLIFSPSRAANSVVNCYIWQKFKDLQAFMHDLVFCRNEEDQIKNEGTRVFTSFLPL